VLHWNKIVIVQEIILFAWRPIHFLSRLLLAVTGLNATAQGFSAMRAASKIRGEQI
jgi:hypothetical protein